MTRKETPRPLPAAELVWEGKYDDRGRRRLPDPDALARPLLHGETLPGKGEANRILRGDNLHALASLLPALRGRVDLVYIDPPFGVGTSFSHRGGTMAVAAYRDFLGKGGNSALHAFFERLVIAHDLLRAGGSAYIHMDYRLHPYFRLIAEEVFGAKNLINDIVWHYRSGGGTKRRFGMKHDNLLLFSKGPGHTFNPDAVRVPYDAVIAKKRAQDFHPAGKVAPDVWDIPRPPNHSKEWTGYATQKPLALLERILLASSNPGDLVLDYYGGAGTTAVAAGRLGRRWILCDNSPSALQTTRTRLLGEPGRSCIEIHTMEGMPCPAPVISPSFQVVGGRVRLHGVGNHLDRLGRRDRRLAAEEVGRDPLALLDFWSVDFGAPCTPFCHQWWTCRRRGGGRPALESAPIPPGPVRVMAVDVFGAERVYTIR